VIENMSDFRALDPFFRIIEQGLAEFVEGDHFFDLLADDVVFDFIITVPNYPRHIVGRDNLIDLYRSPARALVLVAATRTSTPSAATLAEPRSDRAAAGHDIVKTVHASRI